MKVKTFPLVKEEEANAFIESVVLTEQGAVQVTSDNTIVVFYDSTKEGYEDYFKNEMLERLRRNLFNEKVRQHTAKAEIEEYKNTGGKSDKFDQAINNEKDARDNIKIFEAKIKSLETWEIASNI